MIWDFLGRRPRAARDHVVSKKSLKFMNLSFSASCVHASILALSSPTKCSWTEKSYTPFSIAESSGPKVYLHAKISTPVIEMRLKSQTITFYKA